MEERFRQQGSLVPLLAEQVDDDLSVALCRDLTPCIVWVSITSAGRSRVHAVSGEMKTLQAAERFVVAGVNDPARPVRAVVVELLGGGRFEAKVSAEGWLLILPPGSGEYRQRVTFEYESGEPVESDVLPPASQSIDSGGTAFAPLES